MTTENYLLELLTKWSAANHYRPKQNRVVLTKGNGPGQCKRISSEELDCYIERETAEV